MPAITSPPEVPAWDVDADWWGPTWDVVTSVGGAGPDKPRADVPELADQDGPGRRDRSRKSQYEI